MSGDTPVLPTLRQELSIIPAPRGDDGAPMWYIFDPVRNAFHTLSKQAVNILANWRKESADHALKRLNSSYPDMDLEEQDLKDLVEFLYREKLTQNPPTNDPEILARQEAAMRKPFHEQLIHKYLFFRIPLFQPQNFLKMMAPFVAFMFKKLTWVIIAIIGTIGLFFAARQWEQFVSTFMHFFTLEGFIFYAITLVIIKALHELGHAFTAHHFGIRVPIIGLAFLVMFPILYTDTTDAHRLLERRKKVLIDAGGMITELAIASIAIFLWSFLSDGPVRSAAFFAATTSWALSLMVNLNPCMRFDGYYLLSDLCRVQNMQANGFELGRWWMRETLFGLNKPKPISVTPRKQAGLLTYAYTTWIYRFFLFIGIALLVHHLFPKALGIVLFTIEILFFIVAPIWRELKHWWSYRMTILSTRQGRITLGLTLGALALFFVPWQTNIKAPALIRPSLQTEIFPISSGEINAIHITIGDHVKSGDKLMTLRSDNLEFEHSQSQQRIALLTAQLNRSASNMEERRHSAVLDDDLKKEELSLKSIEDEISQLTIYAPHDGIISALPVTIHKGRHVTRTERLMRIVSQEQMELLALPTEKSAARLSVEAKFTFISNDATAAKVTGYLSHLAPTSEAIIVEPILTSVTGGPLAVNEDKDGQLIANTPVFKVKGIPDNNMILARAQAGIVKIKAKAQSPATALWKSIVSVLIKETDF